MFYLGWARWRAGDHEAGSAIMRQSIQRYRSQGLLFYLVEWIGLFADTEAASGRTGAALAALDDLIMDSERNGLQWCRSELHRRRGEIRWLHDPSDVAAAEAEMQRSLEVARAQRARTLELRSALSLGRFYRATDRLSAIPGLIEPVVSEFRTNPDLPELAEAITLLTSVRHVLVRNSI
jgi:predicted ATPase